MIKYDLITHSKIVAKGNKERKLIIKTKGGGCYRIEGYENIDKLIDEYQAYMHNQSVK